MQTRVPHPPPKYTSSHVFCPHRVLQVNLWWRGRVPATEPASYFPAYMRGRMFSFPSAPSSHSNYRKCHSCFKTEASPGFWPSVLDLFQGPEPRTIVFLDLNVLQKRMALRSLSNLGKCAYCFYSFFSVGPFTHLFLRSSDNWSSLHHSQAFVLHVNSLIRISNLKCIIKNNSLQNNYIIRSPQFDSTRVDKHWIVIQPKSLHV